MYVNHETGLSLMSLAPPTGQGKVATRGMPLGLNRTADSSDRTSIVTCSLKKNKHKLHQRAARV